MVLSKYCQHQEESSVETCGDTCSTKPTKILLHALWAPKKLLICPYFGQISQFLDFYFEQVDRLRPEGIEALAQEVRP